MFIYISIDQCIYLSIYIPIYLSIYLFILQSIHLFIRLLQGCVDDDVLVSQ